MQEAEQLKQELQAEVEQILNEFFGDKLIPERTCGVDKRHLIYDNERYMSPRDMTSSFSPVV